MLQAKYMTPNMSPIDHVGISPDIKCSVMPDDQSPASDNLKLYGSVPIQDQLRADPCFLTAQATLTQELLKSKQSGGFPYTGPLKLMSATTVIRHR